jgi:hypothetical protein
MARIGHGETLTVATIEVAREGVRALNESVRSPIAIAKVPDLKRFDYLFPDLQNDPKNLLAEDAKTVQDLIALGDSMHDPTGGVDSDIPAVYTYLGQFVDHDITLEAESGKLGDIFKPGSLKPAKLDAIRATLKNARTMTLDLDSVYDDPAPRSGDLMTVGTVTPLGGNVVPILPVPGKDAFNDVPRKPPAADPRIDREALIGDARNDENLVIAQMQVAFLRAHNAIVGKGSNFDEARRLLRQHYQWVVLHDFLPRICQPRIVASTLARNRWYKKRDADLFMPLEFAVAAYRFGHSMIRATYDHNLNFPDATLLQLFTFTALSGDFPGGLPTLPDNWPIQWDRFVEGKGLRNRARVIDTKLVEPLFELTSAIGNPLPGIEARLAVRNLLRGYLLRMPTGQAVAKKLKITPLTASAIEKAAATRAQKEVLKSSGFSKRTPLWFYVLIEAAAIGKGRLGPVGSTIVAEVLVALARRSESSIFDEPGWKPTLGAKKGKFIINDLLKLAGEL